MGFRTFLNFSKNPSGFSKHERHFRKKKFRLFSAFYFFVFRRRRCRCRCCRIRKCHRYKCFLTKKHFASNLLEAFGVNCIHRFKSNPSWTGITENAKRRMCFDESVGWRTLHRKMEHRMHERGKK